MKKSHVAIVVILDGCCIESLHRAETPSINSILKKGCGSFECKSIYPAATYSAHCSLITGKFPKDHGVVGNSFYDRAAGRIIDFDFEDINEFVASKTLFEAVDNRRTLDRAPIEALRLACVLHDAERKVERDHPSRAAELAQNFLRSRVLSQRRIKKIAKAIRLHHDRPEAVQTSEEKILWDTDKLDALGFVGLMRCMQEAWHLGARR